MVKKHNEKLMTLLVKGLKSIPFCTKISSLKSHLDTKINCSFLESTKLTFLVSETKLEQKWFRKQNFQYTNFVLSKIVFR